MAMESPMVCAPVVLNDGRAILRLHFLDMPRVVNMGSMEPQPEANTLETAAKNSSCKILMPAYLSRVIEKANGKAASSPALAHP
jgi:hypothetical protein